MDTETRDRPEATAAVDARNEQPHFERPQGWAFALVMVGLCLALLCISLDRSIVATAVPKITSDFNSLEDVAWYGSSYLFTTCSFQLFYGKLYARVSIKWTFIVSLLIFELGSAICGAAPNSTVLIVGRAIAGIGCAGVTAGALNDRPKYTGIVTGIMGIALTAAPALGGVFTDHLTWRWCFYVNLPLGAVALVAITFLLRLPPPAERSTVLEHLRNLDIPGTLAFAPGIIALLLALQWGGNTYPWNDWRIIILLVASALGLATWARHQCRLGDAATVPARIIGQRSIYVALFHVMVVGAVTFIGSYYIPIWYQAVVDYTPSESGVTYLGVSGPAALFSLVSGVMTSRIGYYVPSMYIGAIFLSVGSGLMMLFDVDTDTAFCMGALILLGTGVGFALQMGLIVAQSILPPKDTSVGASLMVLGQTLGGAVFLCAAQNIFQSHLVSEIEQNAPGVSPAAVIHLGAAQLGLTLQALGYSLDDIDTILDAYNAALKRVWLMMVVLSCVSVLAATAMEWRNVKPQTKPADDIELQTPAASGREDEHSAV
ncbi:major facilitator superfamily domain-containing protein [Diplogelasinospora grovesii]|uniref:Major facilitator superfamily domain-containing protein n=1 Tax=Diplogelasinospora grovesii TaxID=303347 RepID=A0AAN6NIZ8_9PEZI|nr:major facilitator superfamily domain-containing protein [Diplogelasinospora grovesii]